MFKKIEIWILYLVILLGIPLTIIFGTVVRYEKSLVKRFERITKTALFLSEIPSNLQSIFFSNQLRVQGRFPAINGFNGIPNSKESYLLQSKYDGDLREGIVELIDLRNFEVLHTWNPNINEFNRLVKKVNEFKYLRRDGNDSRALLRHPILLEDGGLVFNNMALRKINACSNLLFQNEKYVFHHSLESDLEGNIWVPSLIYPQSLPIEKVGRETREEGGYSDDGIVKLSSNGKILYEKSVSQILIDNGLEYLLFSVGDSNFALDPIHLNDIQPVNFDGDYWKKGDVFLSLRNQSMVLLYRPSTNKIIWKGTGPFFHQHDINILNNHSISVFNNNSKNFADDYVVDGHNEVIIYNFKTKQYSKYLNESLIKNDVRTPTQGRSSILPNGDLFIEETNFARTLYFNADGSLRWVHVNRAKNDYLYHLGWSRILSNDREIELVNKFLKSNKKCNY